MGQSGSVRVTVTNRLGMHARPAMTFVDEASVYGSKITVRRTDSDDVFDGKSIMELMMLAATSGVELEITAEGDDAPGALETLRLLVEGGFGES